MPVIGRLDEQVNDILITPLERGREPEPAPAPEAPPAPPELVDDGDARETPRARAELPVWLL
jgi:hypothetical protein